VIGTGFFSLSAVLVALTLALIEHILVFAIKQIQDDGLK